MLENIFKTIFALIFGTVTTIQPVVIPEITPVPDLIIPFTSQAPNFNWKDPRLQDGCEEAAVLMAYYGIKDQKLTADIALKEIFSMSEYQTVNYSEYRDTSLADTAERLLRGYFSYENYKIVNDVNLNQIINALREKHLVILPMDGKKLKNPNYSGLGPDRHMLLVIGHDPQTQEFITNDAGTKKGQNYRYSEEVLFSAIRDYSTGYHIPITEVRKNMLVVY